MTTLLEAARQALEALENLQGIDTGTQGIEDVTIWCPEAIDDLRIAIAEAEKAQAQERTPLTDEQIKAAGRDYWVDDAVDFKTGVRFAEDFHGIANHATAAGKKVPETCAWTPMDDDTGSWDSACGQAWSFIDGTPAENNVRFCHGCGKPVEVKGGV